MSDSSLILVTLLGISLLLFLVIKIRLQAFIALLLVSLVVGLAAGMPMDDVIKSVQNGMGGTLGFVAVVVGLGAMFGRLLEISGGVERLAQTLLAKFGEANSQWALTLTGFIVSIPVFFDVGFIIIAPVLYGLTRKTGRSLLYYGVPLIAGMAVTHAFIPPTPGPIAVADLINADLGWVIFWGVLCGLPAAALAGPLFGRYIAKRIPAKIPDYFDDKTQRSFENMPGFGTICGVIALPIFLIVANTLSGATLAEGHTVRNVLGFVGHPFVALTLATLAAIFLLGVKRGVSLEEINDLTTRALEPAGIVILITGAGGVFKQVLIDSGVGDVLADLMASSAIHPVLLAFALAAVIRIAQGSATVAMITAAGVLSPILDRLALSPSAVALMVIAIASGATILSHVNDSGFWLVNRYLGLTEKDTLRSWTMVSVIVALVGVGTAFIFSFFVM